MSKRQPKTCYWQDAPMPREQLVLFASTLEQIAFYRSSRSDGRDAVGSELE